MGWTQTFWNACDYLIDTSIHVTANALDTVGSMANIVGGAALSFSTMMNETLCASYYGSANIRGTVNFSLDVQEIKYSLNGSVPFQHTLHKDGGVFYKLKDYLLPSTVQTASVIFMTSGILLRGLSANIKKWQQNREDKRRYDHEIEDPSLKEYLFVTAESVCSSLSYSLLSWEATSVLIRYTGLLESIQSFTYPSYDGTKINSTFYTGPVTSTLIPVDFQYDHNITVQLPLVRINVLLEEEVNATAMANATYGAGIFLKSENSRGIPDAIPSILGGGAYLASGFFRKRANHLREDRVFHTHVEYSLEDEKRMSLLINA